MPTAASGRADRPADCRVEQLLPRFIERLRSNGYAIRPLPQTRLAIEHRRACLRYDVLASAVDIDTAARVAALHEHLRVPGAFHIAWDLIERRPRLRSAALRLADFDPDYVQLGLHCDPIASWLAAERFGGDQRALTHFGASPQFAPWLDELLWSWRAQGDDAPALRLLRDGAWSSLCALDRSFREAAGRCSSLSGRRSALSAAFSKARRAHPELAAISAWLLPIDFLADAAPESLGYAFEAPRFARDLGPGATAFYGGAKLPRLRRSLAARVAAGGGFVAIFPVRCWRGDRYADLISEPPGPVVPATAGADRPPARRAAAAPAAPLPDEPVLTNPADLIPLRRVRAGKHRLAAAARRKIGSGADDSFPRFVAGLREEGYSFGGFEDGWPHFAERWAYLRYDVHIQDLLAAYVLADLHERLAVVGSFQVSWKYSRYEESVEPYFTKLLEFDRRFVQFGLHAAPTATWYLEEKLSGDYVKQREAVENDEFVGWLLDLHAAFRCEGDAAPGLRRLRQGTDDTLSRIAVSFRSTFGNWRSISGHGNFLTNGFIRAVKLHPELKALRPYFVPVAYLHEFGVERFGFDLEATSFGRDRVRFPRLITEAPAIEARRRSYRGRIANGAGFVVLLHPASWTCSRNASFFLSAEAAAETADDARSGP